MAEQITQLEAAIDDFADYALLVKGRSPATVKGYRSDLRTLVPSCATFAEFTLPTLRAWLADALRSGLARSTMARRTAAARAFSTWAYERGHLDSDVAARLATPQVNRHLPDVVTPARAGQLVEAEINADAASPEAARDRAMLELLYATGMRVGELTGLNLGDVDLARGLAHVTGKGNKQRLVPVGSYAVRALTEWAAEGGANADAPVFPGRGGGTITPRAVQLRMRQLAQRQGLFKRVHPHLLRHSFASHVLESSGDLRGVQELLGHADIATTQIYTKVSPQHLREIWATSHPRT